MPNPPRDVLWLRNQAVSTTNVSVSIADASVADFPLIDVNPAFVRMTGYTREDAIGRNCRFLQGPRSDRSIARAMGDAVREPVEARFVLLNYRKDGGTFWNEINIAPIFGDDGALTYFIAAQLDVTHRVRNNQFQNVLIDIDNTIGMRLDPLEVVQPIARLIANSVADVCAVHILDENGQVVRIASCVSDAITPDAFPLNHRALQWGIERYVTRDAVARAIATGKIVVEDVVLETGDESTPTIVHGAVIVPIVGPTRVYGAFSFGIDRNVRPTDAMDEQLAIEVGHRLGNVFEMSHLYNDLRKAIDVRDEFLSIAAHELRTPISSIKGYSQLLMRGLERGTLLPERLRLGLRTIETAASRLTTLTNDLLEVSRNGVNRVPLHLERISVFDYVSRFLLERQLLRHDSHEFALGSADPGVDIEIDVSRIDQILSNLASNAAKYSSADDPVIVVVERENDGVAIRISDKGAGVDREDIDQIFEPFHRGRHAIDSNVPGMGLGLFISRNIAMRHGGTLTAHSDGLGSGTTFCLWLPAVDHVAAP